MRNQGAVYNYQQIRFTFRTRGDSVSVTLLLLHLTPISILVSYVASWLMIRQSAGTFWLYIRTLLPRRPAPLLSQTGIYLEKD
jgi:hypothetical protein